MKKAPLLIVFIFLNFAECITAQTRNPALDINRANIWHFGAQSGAGTLDAPSLHFINDTAIVIENHGWGGEVASICDSLGNLQAYGGGFELRNRLDSLMKNSGFIGDSGLILIGQMALAVPKPKNKDTIYYFTSSVAFRYTIINMQGDNGKGEVVKKNIQLYPGTVGVKLTAVHHCNGIDVWVVGHEWGSDKFFAYLVTENGIDTVPVISRTGPIDNYGPTYQGGAIKFSPDGNKIAYSSGGGTIRLYLFDFDKSTGIISNAMHLNTISGVDGLSFSQDNRKLYFGSKDGEIIQYNIESGDSASILASKKIVYSRLAKPLTSMQLGRNGKIYVQQGGLPERYYLGAINSPNLLDTLCDYQPFALSLNNARAATDGIMNTIESYFYKGSSAFPCYGDTIFDCNDYNACTADTYNLTDGCVYTPIDCDDSDTCTIDACDSLSGCFYTPIANCFNGLSFVQHETPVVYPTITSRAITIKSLSEIENVSVYSLSGQLVASHDEPQRKSNLVVIDLSKNVTGIYLLVIQTEKSLLSHKIFLTH